MACIPPSNANDLLPDPPPLLISSSAYHPAHLAPLLARGRHELQWKMTMGMLWGSVSATTLLVYCLCRVYAKSWRYICSGFPDDSPVKYFVDRLYRCVECLSRKVDGARENDISGFVLMASRQLTLCSFPAESQVILLPAARHIENGCRMIWAGHIVNVQCSHQTLSFAHPQSNSPFQRLYPRP